MSKSEYPRCNELKIPVHHRDEEAKVAHVFAEDVKKALKTRANYAKFNKLFGCQTCPIIGDQYALYPWDVEAVLERMLSGRLTGTQRLWD
jgi:hypothetical protein